MTDSLQADSIGVLILAAGNSQRFGSDKRMARMTDGRTLLEATLNTIPDTFSRRVVVLRDTDEEIPELIPADWIICPAADADQGLGHSLSTGINFVRDCPGVVIGLGDMPFIQNETWRSIQAALCRHEGVVPVNAGRQGNPVGFRSCFYPALGKLSGDRGAKVLIRQHADMFHSLPCNDTGIFRDIDHPGELNK